MKKTLVLSAIAALFLTACAGSTPPEQGRERGGAPAGHRHGHGHHHGHSHDHAHRHDGQQRGQAPAAARQQFECRNGMTVTVARTGEDLITISTSTDTGNATLQAAQSASGERYVSNQGLYGKSTEWHVKNGEALFSFTDPYNNKVETDCRAK